MNISKYLTILAVLFIAKNEAFSCSDINTADEKTQAIAKANPYFINEEQWKKIEAEFRAYLDKEENDMPLLAPADQEENLSSKQPFVQPAAPAAF